MDRGRRKMDVYGLLVVVAVALYRVRACIPLAKCIIFFCCCLLCLCAVAAAVEECRRIEQYKS